MKNTKVYVENICNEVQKQKKNYHPMVPEIVMTSSFYFNDFDDFATSCSDEFNSYVYTRGTNPTTQQLEEKIAKLEHGEKCKVFSSGMGAIGATLFTFLKQKDHVILVNTVYGASVSLIMYMEKYGITYTIVNSTDIEIISSYVNDKTSLLYFESPSSQKFEVVDLQQIAQLAQAKGILTVIDNTWSSPLFQNPLDYGIDIVVHSCSKYIGGHSDIVCGALIARSASIREIEERGYLYLGSTCSPINAYLALRGMRTLPLRMKQVDNSVRVVLDYLKNDKRIKTIYHPYCASQEQKTIANTYLSGFGSLFAIDLMDADIENMKKFVNALQVFTLGVSWGGFESLVLPAFKGENKDAVVARGLSLTHIRMYVGLEHPDSLIQDLKQALDAVYGS